MRKKKRKKEMREGRQEKRHYEPQQKSDGECLLVGGVEKREEEGAGRGKCVLWGKTE